MILPSQSGGFFRLKLSILENLIKKLFLEIMSRKTSELNRTILRVFHRAYWNEGIQITKSLGKN
jgi:hypothetical protein